MSTITEYTPSLIPAHIASLSDDARNDIATGKWDEVSADALYAACGASERAEMEEARGLSGMSARSPQPPERQIIVSYTPEDLASDIAWSRQS